jgi:hypothetical protein
LTGPVCAEIIDTPSPLGSSGIIALAGNSPQNTDVKELIGQNLDNKGLRARRPALEQTVTASTMIAQLRWPHKVRRHNVPVEILDAAVGF